ncbi:26S proteasome non-ATPase regulatory subunit 2-like [Hydractinia symbiolongicarpus]|uniref:26S proteasome non-ATPase regulatory subunit 2-like n=1 Tax=Hydractinia symbiolongicarpus TaxID=13093 RepID=UPI00254D5B69|nr:26S proteasome non-ATPase regulatory subunit 2-like [Hydractinia symbiolongicarpus]
MAPVAEGKKSGESSKTDEFKKESKDNLDKKKQDEAKEKEEAEMSEEDKQLLEELNMLVQRLKEDDTSLYKPALESLRKQIRASTSSMTSVPKPLKFLRQHFDSLKELYQKWPDSDNRRFLADIISVLGMTRPEERDCLKYRFLGALEALESWGHEYVRHLAEEIRQEYTDRTDGKTEDLIKLAKEIIPYDMKHNAEIDACDLAMEIERLDLLQIYVDKSTYQRVCLYLKSCVKYVPEPEDSQLLKCALDIYLKFNCFPEALNLAIQLNDIDLIKQIFKDCTGSDDKKLMQQQLGYILGRLQIFLEIDEDIEDSDFLADIISNAHLNNSFLALARELDIMEPKVPEDIYKSHLDSRPFSTSSVSLDSARQNLASSFVNGFVNTAFGKDKLLTEDGNKWLYKNKEHGMLSTAASLGMLLLWDVDGGLTQIDKYLYSTEDYIKAGALLACGIVNSGVRNECDPALALLSDYVEHKTSAMQIGSILGLGLAYAGSNREDVLSLILPVLSDSKSSMEVVGVAALACGLIAIASCNGEVTSVILQTMMERSAIELKEYHGRFLALGLGLTYLGKQESVDATVETLKVVPGTFSHWARVMVDVCAYAGTGNVLKIQNLLHICSEHYENDKEKEDDKKKKDEKKETSSKDEKKTDEKKTGKNEEEKSDTTEAEAKDGSHQGIAVLGISAIAMGEDIGIEMAMRAFNHLLQYGEPVIRRSVPLGLALISASNPRLTVVDTLSKFSHDHDAEVAHNSIFAMGVVGAGSNNARLAGMLRQLALYYHKDANNLFMVRIAQGLVHLGKGTLTVSPYQYDRTFMSPVAVGGLMATLTAFFDVKQTILGKSHYLLYSLVSAMQPRMLVTLDTDLKALPVHVRVGQAVDVVGQAGKPKSITGFQTHTTPVLLAHGERAELATDEYIALTPVLEGFVICKKNPEYDPEDTH